jgi:hypothetical protein
VAVQRGAGAASAWATYSTRLGSPVGDTTSGAFRFTCTAVHATCKVTINAAALAAVPGTVGVYPRVLIQRQGTSGGPQTYCEYGDGSFSPATPAGDTVLATQPPSATPAYTPVPIHIGGSADCGWVPPGGGPAPAGLVTEITVPAGYYDVISTFVFLKQ